MNQVGSYLRCPNCGATSRSEDAPTSDARDRRGATTRCPVCEFEFASQVKDRLISVDDFGSNVNALIERARSSGVPADDIVRVLRDELAFSAEMANRGRRLCVEIIDLGPQNDDVLHPAENDGREALASRGRSHVALQ